MSEPKGFPVRLYRIRNKNGSIWLGVKVALIPPVDAHHCMAILVVLQ